jgi:hypothetical protein
MRLTILLLAGAAVGCNSSSIFGVSASGETARVEWSSTESAGGQVYLSMLTVDSVTATYEVSRCQGSATKGPCVTTEQRTGVVPPAVLLQLFERAQTRTFRELKSEYRIRGDIVPPDGGWTELTVVVGERAKAVRWDKHASIPDILREYGCLMLAATESLLCD